MCGLRVGQGSQIHTSKPGHRRAAGPPPPELEGAPCRGPDSRGHGAGGDLRSRCREGWKWPVQGQTRGRASPSQGELGRQLTGHLMAPSHGGKGWVGPDKNPRETPPSHLVTEAARGRDGVTPSHGVKTQASGRPGKVRGGPSRPS